MIDSTMKHDQEFLFPVQVRELLSDDTAEGFKLQIPQGEYVFPFEEKQKKK